MPKSKASATPTPARPSIGLTVLASGVVFDVPVASTFTLPAAVMVASTPTVAVAFRSVCEIAMAMDELFGSTVSVIRFDDARATVLDDVAPFAEIVTLPPDTMVVVPETLASTSLDAMP